MNIPIHEARYTAAERAILGVLGGDTGYLQRFRTLKSLSRSVRASEYLLTNACNIRCDGCWFFGHDFDKNNREQTSLERVKEFAQRERARGVNYAIIIGGEPTLIPQRLEAFAEAMDYVTISTNGLKPLPFAGFERFAVQISLFGGGPLDDQLRAIKPGGVRFSGLFDQALLNYRGDPRACFVYAITEDGLPYIENTVRRIRDNGNRVSFNFYSKYGSDDPLHMANAPRLEAEALRVRELFPEAVLSHPYFIHTLVSGRSHFGRFGYDVCPSLSVDDPQHAERLLNGNPVLPGFNAWAADCETINFCCTSGHCSDCRDSQAILSWLLVNLNEFRASEALFKTWIEVAESYWKQFIWSPLHDPPPPVTATATATPISLPILVDPPAVRDDGGIQ